ncbi:hypothetical protein BXZ70DRAFT_70043 [Cristinia sonorae]|uniref:Uncharacterized protein n=1 Tax=Cristinia sonorae TaxID=1940300 RepID=A0A8K0UQ88_9AGAR|nr:hypothetical protein BXZ70DRAFT_70043 [Cristinia sonorae]
MTDLCGRRGQEGRHAGLLIRDAPSYLEVSDPILQSSRFGGDSIGFVMHRTFNMLSGSISSPTIIHMPCIYRSLTMKKPREKQVKRGPRLLKFEVVPRRRLSRGTILPHNPRNSNIRRPIEAALSDRNLHYGRCVPLTCSSPSTSPVLNRSSGCQFDRLLSRVDPPRISFDNGLTTAMDPFMSLRFLVQRVYLQESTHPTGSIFCAHV